MFLTPSELVDLTGYKRASLQVRWLQRQGIRHYVRRDGKPAVVAVDLSTTEPPRPRPDFSKVLRAG